MVSGSLPSVLIETVYDGLELRRRQSLERVHAVLVAEDYTALRPPHGGQAGQQFFDDNGVLQ